MIRELHSSVVESAALLHVRGFAYLQENETEEKTPRKSGSIKVPHVEHIIHFLVGGKEWQWYL